MEAGFRFLSDRVDLSGLPHQEFMRRVIDRNLTVFANYSIISETPVTAALSWPDQTEIIQQYAPLEKSTRLLLDGSGIKALVYISHWGKFHSVIYIASRTADAAFRVLTWFVQTFPALAIDDPKVVPVEFWAMTRNGAQSRTRMITAPSWDEIDLNYTARTREGLINTMAMRRPEGGGRLMLWHGKPGTGKSYAIRALARQWRPWCNTHYIVDPEHFFGDSDYMLSVIFTYATDSAAEPGPPSPPPQPQESDANLPHYTLLIMEDADEFLGVDAKRREGQAMSRLLNMCDGLIGQGLNLLLLITTNEPIEKIHKAVQREGRCLANIEFGMLDALEVQDWLVRHSLPAEPHTDKTLAELYSLGTTTKQIRSVADETPMGFRHRPLMTENEAKEIAQ